MVHKLDDERDIVEEREPLGERGQPAQPPQHSVHDDAHYPAATEEA